MAPSAIETVTGSKIRTAPVVDVITPKFNDWRADLQKNGWAIIKGAVPHDRAVSYQRRAFEWLKSFGTALDFDDPNTWIKGNLPVMSKINTFHSYALAHEKFMWDARLEPGVLEAFARIWGTTELLVSFDSLNITFPNRKDVPRKPSWEHIDQSPIRQGLQCVQGIINLSPSAPEDGGLVVYPSSHAVMEEFFKTQTDEATWEPMDRYMFTEKHLEWFKAKGIEPYKVCANVGDLIVWDSRTIHYGSEPTEKSSQIRTVIYAAYTPARLASPEQLALKKEVFEVFGGTTHWPHDNIVRRSTHAFLDDGTRDPRDRDRPREMPDMTDKLLRLAGAKSY